MKKGVKNGINNVKNNALCVSVSYEAEFFAERANKQRTPRAVAIFVHTKRFPLRKPFF